MEIDVVDDRVSPNRWWNATTVYIDAGRGEFQVLTIAGTAIETTSQRTVIGGNTYEILGSRITAGDIREGNPSTMGIRLDYCNK